MFDDGSGWDNTLVQASLANVIVQPVVVIDPAGQPQIAFTHKNTYGAASLIRYAYVSGSVWVAEDVGAITSAHSQGIPGFDVDGRAVPHVACLGPSTLTYGYRDGGSWQTFDLPRPGGHDTGFFASLVAGDDGLVHIAFSDGLTLPDTLRYATVPEPTTSAVLMTAVLVLLRPRKAEKSIAYT